jgi:accessory colonization factor AcfC
MCSDQIPKMENDFKTTTKTAQSLVKDSSQDLVNDMLQTLNVQKEVIVRLRKEIPERIKYLKALLPNVESLETGISDLNIWVDKGENILSANKMEGSQKGAEDMLEKHKVCPVDFDVIP